MNAFLEKMPQNAGNNALIAAGIIWGVAAALGLITMVKVQELTSLRAEFKETQAVQPSVPKISESAVSKDLVESFAAEFGDIYPGLDVNQQGSKIMITSGTTSNFGQFREALAHVYNGGSNWRVSLDKLCVGRECDQKHKLAVALSIKQVSVENPN
ncbi:MAG: hypothetical protein AAF569_06725 [Pseudomonadota bacterium]